MIGRTGVVVIVRQAHIEFRGASCISVCHSKRKNRRHFQQASSAKRAWSI
jgi:hypothetical protein